MEVNLDNKRMVERILQKIGDQSFIKGVFLQTRDLNNYNDGDLKLKYKGKTFKFKVEVKLEVREYQINKIVAKFSKNGPYIIIANTISLPVKEKLRALGVSYIDGAGNIFLQHNGDLIWLDGFKDRIENREIPNRAFTKTGLKVIFTILRDNESINLPYRELGDLANVSIGSITTALAGLKNAGFITTLNKKEIKLQNKQLLLDRWVTGYREILKPSLYLGTFQLRRNFDWRNSSLPDGAVWGGESAGEIITDYLNPEIATIYTPDTTTSLIKKMLLVPNEKGNLRVYHKFWQQEDTNDELGIAPVLLVYTDLMSTANPRCQETAEIIYKKYLRDLFQ